MTESREKQLIKRVKFMREFIETQISHCMAQNKRFEKLGDHATAMDYYNIGRGAEKVLKEYDSVFEVDLREN